MSTLQHDGPLVAGPSNEIPEAVVPAHRFLAWAEAYGFVGLFVVMLLVFSLWSKTSGTFATMANVSSIIGNQSTLLVISVGMVIPLLAGQIDLSVGATAGATSVVTSTCMARFNWPLLPSMLLGLVFALLIGVIMGILVARVSANSFVITFGVATVLGGLVEWYTKSLPITTNISRGLQNFGSLNWFRLPRLTVALIPMVIIVLIAQDRTPYGRYLQAIGSNPRAAHLVGVPVARIMFLSFVSSSFLAGIGGILLTARSGGASPNAGTTLLFPAFTAVFLGMATIRPGKPNVIGTVLAVYFLAAAVSGFTMAGAETWVSDVFDGVALLVAISMATWFGRRQGVKRI